jgi:hypothetical protein
LTRCTVCIHTCYETCFPSFTSLARP